MFRLFGKHTKFEKIFLMALTNQLIYLENVKTTRKIFSNYVCFSKSANFKANALVSAQRHQAWTVQWTVSEATRKISKCSKLYSDIKKISKTFTTLAVTSSGSNRPHGPLTLHVGRQSPSKKQSQKQSH